MEALKLLLLRIVNCLDNLIIFYFTTFAIHTSACLFSRFSIQRFISWKITPHDRRLLTMKRTSDHSSLTRFPTPQRDNSIFIPFINIFMPEKNRE